LKKNRWILILFIFLSLIFVGGYEFLKNPLAITMYFIKGIYKSHKVDTQIKDIKGDKIINFKNNIMSEFKNIKSVSISYSNVSFFIEYTLQNDLTDAESEKIIVETIKLLDESSFEEAILNEGKREIFFSHIDLSFTNPSTKFRVVYETRNYTQQNHTNMKWTKIEIPKD
jgi:hypothetical protein